MIPLQRFLGLLGSYVFVNFASAGDIIKEDHQMLSRLTSFSQHGRASAFWKSKMRGNCRASHFGDAIRGMYSSSVSVGVVHVLFARARVQSTM